MSAVVATDCFYYGFILICIFAESENGQFDTARNRVIMPAHLWGGKHSAP